MKKQLLIYITFFLLLFVSGFSTMHISGGGVGPELVTDGVFEVTSLGADLAAGWDFTNWDAVNSTINDSDTFTADADYGYIRKALLTAGKTFQVVGIGTSTAGSVNFNSTAGNSSPFSVTKYNQATNTSATIQSNTSGAVVDVTTLTVKEVTFDSWTLGDGAGPGTSTGSLTNKVNIDGSQAAAGEVKQSGILTVGAWNRVSYIITRAAGTIKAKAGTTSGTTQNLSGTYAEDILCAGNTDLVFEYDADFIGTLDSVSVNIIYP